VFPTPFAKALKQRRVRAHAAVEDPEVSRPRRVSDAVKDPMVGGNEPVLRLSGVAVGGGGKDERDAYRHRAHAHTPSGRVWVASGG
jgi:hypothetical protein